METVTRRPAAVWVLLVDLVILGFGGLYGGILFLIDPSGARMGVTLSLLDGLPLRDFLLPGLFLLLIMGVTPLALCIAVWTRWRKAWEATVLLGILLILWLGGEFLLWGYQAPIQAVTSVLGVVTLGACLMPSVRLWLKG
jgi:hypothetical protein